MTVKDIHIAVRQLIKHIETVESLTPQEVIGVLQALCKDLETCAAQHQSQQSKVQHSVYICMAQSKLHALQWVLKVAEQFKSHDTIANKVKNEIQVTKSIIKYRSREDADTITNAPIPFPKGSDAITSAYNEWESDTIEPNLHIQSAEQFDDFLLPYVKMILNKLPHDAALALSRVSAITDLKPAGKGQSEWIQEVSSKLGVPIERDDATLESIARQIKVKYESESN